MNDIAGIPYVEAEFDKNGNLKNPVALPAGTTDLIVISHGWNNDAAEAAHALPGVLHKALWRWRSRATCRGESLAIVGVIWPSKKFDELVAVSGVAGRRGRFGQPAARGDAESRKVLEAKLGRMKEFFTEPSQQKTPATS